MEIYFKYTIDSCEGYSQWLKTEIIGVLTIDFPILFSNILVFATYKLNTQINISELGLYNNSLQSITINCYKLQSKAPTWFYFIGY